MATKKTQTKKEVIKPSTEDLILGAQEEIKEYEAINYQSIDMRYEVTVIETGRKVEVNGREIGTFLGQNAFARKQLEQGEKKIDVVKKDKKVYHIDVI